MITFPITLVFTDLESCESYRQEDEMCFNQIHQFKLNCRETGCCSVVLS